jgi:hypothetical protein
VCVGAQRQEPVPAFEYVPDAECGGDLNRSGTGASSVSRGVTLHRDLNFTGVSEAFASDVPDLRGSRVGDDQATSVSVSRGCQARLYQHLNYEGAYTEVSSSMDALRGSKVGDDSVTSIKVRCDTLTRSKTGSGGLVLSSRNITSDADRLARGIRRCQDVRELLAGGLGP